MLLKAVLSVLLLGLVVRSLDLARLQEFLSRVDPWPVALAALVLAAVPAVSLPRWRAILTCLGYSLPSGTLARALYIGSFFSQVLPSSIGGDAWRIWFCTRAGVPLGTAANSVLIERLAGLAAVLLSFGLTFPLLLRQVGDDPVRWALWGMLAGCLAIALALALLSIAAGRLQSFRLLRSIAGLGDALAAVTRSVRRIGLLLATALVGQLVAITAFFTVSWSLGASLSFGDCAATLSPALLTALVPVSLGGWGLREGAFVVLLKFYGVSGEQALVLSILFGLALLVATIPGLALWLGLSHAAEPGRR